MHVVYIAGPFRGPAAWDIEQNIRRAEELALKVWQAGYVSLCPHANTRFFQGSAPDEVWLKGDLELLKRCDALLTVSGWQFSTGAREEVRFALESQIPVYYSLEELKSGLPTI